MWKWVIIVVSGSCSIASGYMAMLAVGVGDRGVFLFSAFGILFGIACVAAVIGVISTRRSRFGMSGRELSFGPRQVAFVPHWFVMTALTTAGIAILAAILIPIFF